jgi:hypothetical protein
LLENAVQFSPPSETIRVTGLFDMDGYQLAVSDRGVGISEARMAEMNRVLHRPPALGLSVEPTLGIYVVAKLAHRHGLAVELIRGVPGITARVTIPRDHLEVSTSFDPRPWGSEHTRRIVAERSRAASGTHYSDAETRAYVLMREQERRAGEMVPSSGAGAETDQVIDLTRPPYDDGEELAALPVRTPGLAFIEDDEAVSSITPGDGAAEIKSALAAYDRGRRSAENPENGPSAEDRDDEEWA